MSKPTITQQPQNTSVDLGQTLTLVVAASGEDLTYQWRRFGQNVAGATAATYVQPNLTLSDSGAEYVVVVSNAAGSVSSSPAIATVVDTAGPGALTVAAPTKRTVTEDFITLTGTAYGPGVTGAARERRRPIASWSRLLRLIVSAATGAFSAEGAPLKGRPQHAHRQGDRRPGQQSRSAPSS